MKRSLLSLLRCPETGSELTLLDDDGRLEIESGELQSRSGKRYPIVRGIPRFVPPTSYADSFGLQWNRFRRTQLDSHSGHPISAARFQRYTRWTPEALRGTRVLDVGCGAGRFAEIALQFGAHLVALDYSNAVDACRENHAAAANLDVVQSDIYRLPFAPGSFDFVYCLGVLQHTPDVKASFHALPPMLRPGGQLAVDLYPKLWLNALWPKYWVRPLTRRMNTATLFRLVERAVPILLPVSRALGKIPGVGPNLRKIVPVANYEGILPLDETQLREWAVLDTFDMLAPAYDSPQTVGTLRTWFEEAAMTAIEVERHGFVVGRGTAA